MSPLLVALLFAAADQAASPSTVQLTRTVEALPVEEGDAVACRSEVVELVRSELGASPGSRYRYQTLRCTLPDGSTSPAVATLNARIRHDLSDQPEEAAAEEAARFEGIRQRLERSAYLTGSVGSSARLLVNRAPFVAVEVCDDWVGAYPSNDCSRHLLRMDTDSTWSWIEGIRPERRKVFLDWCTEKLEVERAAQRARWGPTWDEIADGWGPMDGAFDGRCTEKTVRNGSVNEKGELVLQLGRSLPHVAKAAAYDLVLPAGELDAFADPRGPLADVIGIAR